MSDDICSDDVELRQPGPDDVIEEKPLGWRERLINRKTAIKLALGGVAALALGKTQKAEAAWIIGYCTYSYCQTCRRVYMWAYKYQNEYGAVWCGTYQLDHIRNCDTTCSPASDPRCESYGC